MQADVYKLYDDGTVNKLADKYGLTDFIVVDQYRADKAD